jgi:hypothetical protein
MLNTTQGNDLQLDADVTVGVAWILQVTKAIGKTAQPRWIVRSQDACSCMAVVLPFVVVAVTAAWWPLLSSRSHGGAGAVCTAAQLGLPRRHAKLCGGRRRLRVSVTLRHSRGSLWVGRRSGEHATVLG